VSLLQGALAMARSATEGNFTESFTFFTSTTIPNPDTLEDVTTETPIHENIPGRIKYPTGTVSESSAVGQRFAEQSVTASVAVGSTPNVLTDHLVRVVSSTVDPGLVGRTFRVTGQPASGQVSAHRYPIEAVS
jgi:hypothetical protein